MKNTTEPYDGSVIYSFQSRWENPLKSGNIKVFFRKTKPRSQPQKVYFYLGSPIMQIIGYSKVKKIEAISLEQSKSLLSAGMISEKELFKYIGNVGRVYAFWIEESFILPAPIPGIILNQRFGFHPPQSFCHINRSMEEFILRCLND